MAMTLGSGPDVWIHVTMVWSVGQPIVMYENGVYVSDGNSQLYASNVNTLRKVGFGIEHTDVTNPPTYGTGYIDGVRMFNRPLTAAEVQALYNDTL